MIHYFNPGHENAVLNRQPSYSAPSSITTLMSELSALPVWYADEGDIVAVGEKYDLLYYHQLSKSFTHLPKVVYHNHLNQYRKALVCMWGIAPQAIRIMENWNRNYSLALQIPLWHEKFIYLNSRMIARDVLEELQQTLPYFNSLSLPLFMSDIESVESIMKTYSTKLLAKSPFSSSGRGLLWLPPNGLNQSERQVLQGMFNKQSQVSIEQVLDKRIDFAMEFMSDGLGNVNFVGYSLFNTSDKGAYLGNFLGTQANIERKLCEYIDNHILLAVKYKLQEILSLCCGSIYKGCIGVDMMIYMESNSYKLQPCVEINMRFNMGYLALKLSENYISKCSEGSYILDFSAKGEIFDSHLKMLKQYPLVVADGRVKSGYLSLCPIDKKTKYRAYILIDEL